MTRYANNFDREIENAILRHESEKGLLDEIAPTGRTIREIFAAVGVEFDEHGDLTGLPEYRGPIAEVEAGIAAIGGPLALEASAMDER